MYWYSSMAGRFITVICFGIFVMSSCKPDVQENGRQLKYFDIKGFFNADSARLTKLNKPVYKTVMHNKDSESKMVHINNWGREFSLFTGSDINKPAWKQSYSIEQSGDFLIYKAKDPDLWTREIIIKKINAKVKWILIFNYTKNILYRSVEKLTYYPDSLYYIQKSQSVRLLGTNKYRVKGIFNYR